MQRIVLAACKNASQFFQSLDGAGQEFDGASKSKKFIRSCGPVNARNSIVIAKMHDAGNGVLQVSGGAEYFHSLVGQIARPLQIPVKPFRKT
jgi:hypothetical protein